MPPPSCRVAVLERLRDEISKLVPAERHARSRLAFGIEAVDIRLAGGGLSAIGLHEVSAGSVSMADDAAATLFVAGIAARAAERGTVVWIMGKSDLFAPGLANAGLQSDRLLQVEAQRNEDALAVVEDTLRSGVAVVVGEVSRADLTITRRLQLAAEGGKSMAVLLRRWRKQHADPLAESSSALTRWRISASPSGKLSVAGVGRPRWRVELVRQRSGDPHEWLLEGCDAQGRLAIPADVGDRPVTPVQPSDRQAA